MAHSDDEYLGDYHGKRRQQAQLQADIEAFKQAGGEIQVMPPQDIDTKHKAQHGWDRRQHWQNYDSNSEVQQ